MAGLASVLSPFFSPVTGAEAIGSQAGTRPGTEPSSVPSEKTDVFAQGQWWKNTAMSRSAVGTDNLSQCKCGNCPKCAVQAYQRNSALSPVTPDSPATAGESASAAVSSGQSSSEKNPASSLDPASAENTNPVAPKGLDGEPLNREELAVLEQLEKADTEVRAHEAAHLAVAGSLARGGANFEFKTGPDGKRYAVAGEVAIDTSKGDTPEETLSKMRTVRAAALAPADPSPQDRKVAAQATVAMTEAVQEIRQEKIEETEEQQAAEEQDKEETTAAADSQEPDKTETADVAVAA